MIAPDLRGQNGPPYRQREFSSSPPSPDESDAARIPAAVQAVRSAIGGAAGRYPLAVLITAAAVAGVTAGWLVKRR